MLKLHEISDADLQAELARREKEKRERFIHPESPIGWWRVSTEGDCEGKSTKDLGVHYGHICELALGLAGTAFYALNFEEVPRPTHNYAPKTTGSVYVGNIADIARNGVTEAEAEKLAKFFGPEWQVVRGNYYKTVKISRK